MSRISDTERGARIALRIIESAATPLPLFPDHFPAPELLDELHGAWIAARDALAEARWEREVCA